MSENDYLPLVTNEEWKDFVEVVGAPFDLYVHATGGIVNKLDEILAKSNSFEELKKELTGFVAERRDFLAYATKHYP